MLAVLLSVFVVACLVQIGFCEYYLPPPDEDDDADWHWMKKMAQNPADLPQHPTEKVSVIICAHNEADNLAMHLPQVFEQFYCDADGTHLFEVIVVNDRSADGTAELLRTLSGQYPNLKIVTISADERREFPGKKFALSRGVEACSHDIILMTDADCYPDTDNWISWMAYPFTKGADIVGGYGGFVQRKGFLNSFIQCETIHTFAQYSGYCRRGKPYMAVGRNLACRKQLLEAAMQHPLWKATVSGDDDMLIRLCANKNNMVVNSHPDSHTYTEAKQTWREYLQQKQRHVSTGKYYAPSVKRLLGIYAAAHAITWAGIILIIANVRLFLAQSEFTVLMFFIACGVMALRVLCFKAVLTETGKKLSTGYGLKNFWYIFDFAWMLYNFVLTPYILWKNKQTWR